MKYCDRKISKVEVKPRFLILETSLTTLGKLCSFSEPWFSHLHLEIPVLPVYQGNYRVICC